MFTKLPTSTRLAVSFLLLVGGAALFPASAQNTISGTIMGRVLDKKTDKPLPGAVVRIVNTANGGKDAAKTDSTGEYRLPFVPEGSYNVTASLAGYLPEPLPNFAVNFGRYNEVRHDEKKKKYHWLALDLKLSQPALKGEVRDEEGQALAGSAVTVRERRSWMTRTVWTGQDGGYEFPALPTGEYLVNASWNGGSAESLPLLLDRAEVRAPEIRLTNATRRELINKLSAFQVLTPALRLGNSTGGAAAQATAGQSAPASTGAQTRRRRVSEGEKAASLVQAVDATRSAHFGARELEALPLGGATYMRSFDELALLAPGVAPPPFTPGARGPGVGFGVGTAGQFSVNGLRARANNFSVDGSDNNDADVGVRRQGFVGLVPQAIESVSALSVVTLLWDAELGRNAGGQINVVSQYGVNQWHGQAWGFFTGSRLNARNFFDYSGGPAGGKDSFTRTQAGGVLGGPLAKDRSHLFASFERVQVNAATEQHFATPTLAERRFVDLRELGGDRLRTLNSGAVQEFDNQRTPLGDNILSFYPLPNHAGGPFGANTFTQILPASGAGIITSLRLTQQFAERHTFNGRYNFTNDRRALPSVNRAINSALAARTKSHNLSLVLDSAFTLTHFNQARFSFGRTRLDFRERPDSPFTFEQNSLTKITLPQGQFDFIAQTGRIGELVIEPFSPVGAGVFYFPQERASNTFQYADTFSWLPDRHLVKFGGNLRRYQLNSRLDRLYRPQVVYGGGLLAIGNAVPNAPGQFAFNPDLNARAVLLTGVQQASLGSPSALLQTLTAGPPDSTVGLRFNEYQLFLNDNWRVRRNFTLDYGLRYEYNSVPHSVDKRIEHALTLEALPPPGVSRFNSAERTNKFNAALDAYRRVLGGRNRIYEQDRNNFGPHLGLAWALDRDGRTALRAGYGIYYDAIIGAVVTQSRNVFPREIPVNVDPAFLNFDVFVLHNPAFLKLVQDPQQNFTNAISLLRPGACNQFGTCNQVGGAAADFVALLGALFNQNRTGGGRAFTLPEKRLRTPYAQHWQLSLERELFDDYFFSAAYVGTKGTKLTRLVTPNRGSLMTPYIPLANVLNGVRAVVLSPNTGSAFVSKPFPQNEEEKKQPARPERNLGAYQVYENSAASNYHALQLEARKRYDRGLQFTAAYTWSHALDDVSDVFTLAGAPLLPQNWNNLRLERASANFDLRQRFAASLIWDLPFYQEPYKGLGRWLGGWQVAGIFQAQTGQPFTLTVPFDNNFDGNLSDRPATEEGLTRINEQGWRRLVLAPNRSFRDYLNFIAQGNSVTPGNGVIGRNTERGGRFVNLDLALNKEFGLSERQALTIRSEFFNLFNRAQFGLPSGMLGAPGFGTAVETAQPARIIQFALKYHF